MKKPIIFTLLGVPGSGKSHFSSNLSPIIGAIRLNSDAMRLAIFKTNEETTRIYNTKDRSVLNSYVFGAIDYAASAVLSSGANVIYDANNNSREERAGIEKLAKEYEAQSVVIWIQTPHDIAISRIQARDETQESRRFSVQRAGEVIAKHSAKIDDPGTDECVIIIDGLASAEEQLKSFKEQMDKLAL